MATELAEKVASAIAAADPGGEQPEVRVLGNEVDAAGLPIGGEIDIEIKYKTNTFILYGLLPASDSDSDYEFDLSMKRDADEKPFGHVRFRFKDKDQWSVSAGIGEVKFGENLTVETFQVTVYKGTPPPPPNGPAANALPA